ncbi:biotin carboxyl carrier protein of acetyl-CoA carboxylase, chloroplastic isoform X1 [Euphorbia lathyris]|uniref:biotin carboxyl carrier protein of acetyl-CoA carboxylase, chloroplastic isoform X1 n=1 Tax=Euphorbia lathyris TaxID=212925 RepID=UPI003313E83C
MASSLSTTSPSISASASASASAVVKIAANLPHYRNSTLSGFSFRLSPNPKLRFSTKVLQPVRNSSSLVRAQLNEVRFFQWFSIEDLFSNFQSFVESILGSSVAFKVAVDGSSNASASPPIKSEISSKDAKLSDKPSAPVLATEESISQFITQVSSLVKLVDSRDIVELQLKQNDCELVIRKKEALPQPPSPAPVVMMHPPSPSPQPLMAPAPPAGSPTASSSASSTPSQSSSPPAAKSQKSSLPPLKCPMAGTFYRSPAPGEPVFVKVGDKVQKGQVLCIIEAMKLMNEIEADQSGTIVEIIAEDGKPVSVDQPLFVIEP